MFQKITLILLLLFIISCKKTETVEKDKIKTANWLLGKWETKTADGNLSENWTQLNDSTFEGQSLFIKGKDTLHFESITLQQKGEELIYNAKVKGQNDNKSVPFKLTLGNDKQLVFENLNHDYPKRIFYTLINKDSLVASISGVQQGKTSWEKFGMKKTK